MNGSIEKLTGPASSRYDKGGAKYMSESTVIELIEKTDPEIYNKWRPILKEAKDANTRSTIMKMIADGIEPPSGSEEDTKRAVKEKTQEEIDKEFEEMVRREKEYENRSGEERVHAMDKLMDEYVKRAPEQIGNDSVAPGEVMTYSTEISWAKYGWSDTERESVRTLLVEEFKDLELGEKQAETVLELLLSKGKKPADVTIGVIRDIKQKAHADLESLDERTKYAYQGNSSILALEALGLELIEIRHFVLPEIYESQNDDEYEGHYPKNTEELAWQIMHAPGDRYKAWGVKGDFPLLKMQIEPVRDKNDNPVMENGVIKIDHKKSGYRVDTANMTRWIRHLMWEAYDLNREDPQDFISTIQLKKRYPVTFGEMLTSRKQYFTSEDGETSYDMLMQEWMKEAIVMSTVRSWDVEYKKVIGNGDELMKVFAAMFDSKNILTRGIFKTNVLNMMTTMPLDFGGTENGQWQSDNKLGAAWIDIYRAYDKLSDFDSLADIFGRGSSMFTRKGWELAAQEIAKEKIITTGVSRIRGFLTKEALDWYDKAFDANGEVTEATSPYFIKLINIFREKMPGSELEFTVRQLLTDAAAEKYGSPVKVKAKTKTGEYIKDENNEYVMKHVLITKDKKEDLDSIRLAEVIAWSLSTVMGARAKNDTAVNAYDYMTKLYNTQMLRQKYPHRGDKFGNKYSMMQFKRMAVDPLNAITTESYEVLRDEKGEVVLDKKGKPMKLDLTAMQVMEQLSELMSANTRKLKTLEAEHEGIPTENKALREAKQREIDQFKAEMDQAYQNAADKMSFKQRTISNYYDDHLAPANGIYKELMDAEEITFDKFTEYTVYGGVRFKLEEFQEEVQDKWIHKIRYMLDTYPSLNMNMKVRVIDQTATSKNNFLPSDHKDYLKPVYQDVTLAEAMFGHELMNRAAFWKRDDKGNPVNMVDASGKKVKGMYEIDYNLVQQDKQLLWKQWFLTKVATDLHAHQALHSNDPRFNFTYYQNVVDAISSIAGDIKADEYDFKATMVDKKFFTKQDTAWLRQASRTENFDLYWKAILFDLFWEEKPQEGGIGILLGTSLLMREIVRREG